MLSSQFGLAHIWAQGDGVLRAVALLLLAMSVLSWYLILTRTWRVWALRRASHAAQGFWHEHHFADGMNVLTQSGGDNNPYLALARQGEASVIHHKQNQQDLHGQINLAEWVSESLRGSIDEQAERLYSGLSILASIGSTAPFVGLFGTVWGIYHALVQIGQTGQAGLDQIAGPVGEALIMTAAGLAVAIPAVLGYNALTRANKSILNRLHRFARQLHAYFLTGAPVGKKTAKGAH